MALSKNIFLKGIEESKSLPGQYNNLRYSNSPLIRLGVLLGFSDCSNIDEVKKFLDDENDFVIQETKEILEEIEN